VAEIESWAYDVVADMQRVWWWRELPDSAAEMYAEVLSAYEEAIARSAVRRMSEAIEQWPSKAAVINFCRLARDELETFDTRHERRLSSISSAEGVPMPDDIKQRFGLIARKGTDGDTD
jgi:hypothetical protein